MRVRPKMLALPVPGGHRKFHRAAAAAPRRAPCRSSAVVLVMGNGHCVILSLLDPLVLPSRPTRRGRNPRCGFDLPAIEGEATANLESQPSSADRGENANSRRRRVGKLSKKATLPAFAIASATPQLQFPH